MIVISCNKAMDPAPAMLSETGCVGNCSAIRVSSLDRSSLIFGLLFFFSVAVAAIGAVILGFGTAAILAVLTAWFVLTAAIGGPLRSDLQMMACHAGLVNSVATG